MHRDRTRPVAIVTGAGSGIGTAIARALADVDMALVLVGRRMEPLEAVGAELERRGATIVTAVTNLGDPEAPEAIVATARRTYGRIDVVVNNVGIIHREPLGEVTTEHFDAQVAVNVRAPLMLVQAALPLLREAPAASVVNITSTSGLINRPGQAVYGLTKAALNHLTRTMAAELAPIGIRVNAIAPGPTDTPAHRSWAPDRRALDEALAPRIPLGRVGEPTEVARWVRHLCDPRAGWVTGAVLPVDGGFSIDFS